MGDSELELQFNDNLPYRLDPERQSYPRWESDADDYRDIITSMTV